MKTKVGGVLATVLISACVIGGGCGRDVRVNSDPGPGGPSAADTGKPVTGAAETSKGTASGSASTAASTGTDSTGRPGDASGGVTGGGSGSGTSGTRTSGEDPNPKKTQ